MNDPLKEHAWPSPSTMNFCLWLTHWIRWPGRNSVTFLHIQNFPCRHQVDVFLTFPSYSSTKLCIWLYQTLYVQTVSPSVAFFPSLLANEKCNFQPPTFHLIQYPQQQQQQQQHKICRHFLFNYTQLNRRRSYKNVVHTTCHTKIRKVSLYKWPPLPPYYTNEIIIPNVKCFQHHFYVALSKNRGFSSTIPSSHAIKRKC